MSNPKPYFSLRGQSQRVRRWFVPPIFPHDETQTRRASLLNIVLWGIIAFATLLLIRDALESNTPITVLLVNGMAVFLSVALLITMRLGKVKLASAGLVILGLITVTGILASLGTIRTPPAAIYLIVIICAGLLFDLSGIIISAISSSVMTLGLIVAENAGWLPAPDHTVGGTQWFTYTVIFILTGGLSFLGSHSTQLALARADRELSERKQAEQALHLNQENFRVLLDTIVESVLLIETDGTVVVANPTVARRMRTTPEQLVGKCVYDFIPPALAEQRKEHIAQLIRTRQPVAFEDTREDRTYFTSAAPVLDAQGQVTRIALFGFDLTARKQAEELYRALVAASPDGISLLDPQGRLQFASPRALEMFGFAPTDNLVGKSLLEYFPPHEHAHVMNNWQHVLRAKPFNDAQYELCRKDGTRFFGEIITNRMYDNAGNVKSIIAVMRDITERKRVNDALRASNKHLELLAQAGRELSTTLDLRVIYSTLAQIVRRAMPCDFIFVSNYEASQQLIRCVYALSPQEELDATTFPPIPLEGEGRGTQSRVIRSGEPLLLNDYAAQLKTATTNYFVAEDGTIQTPSVHDDEDESPQSVLIVPLKLDGKVVGVIQVMSTEHNAYTPPDLQFLESLALYAANAMAHAHLFARVQKELAERKHAEEELQELNQTLEQRVQERSAQVQDLYDNAPCGYHSLDANGMIVRMNQTELDWLGYTREEILGVKHFRDLITPASQQMFADNFAGFMTRGWVKEIEHEMIRKDGTILPVMLNATAVYDAEGNYVMSRSTMFDITERRKADLALHKNEAYLRASRDELSAANLALAKAARLKDEFLASMSHELRTPLTGILGLSEVLQTGIYGTLSEKQNSTLRTIEESGRHLLNLINDILDLSKIEAGKLELQPETFSVDDLCQASLRMIKQIAASKHQRVSFSIRPTEIIVNADPRRLKQILVNLLSNAVKFTPEKGELGLQVEADAAQHVVRFTVWDKGIGIAPADQAKLFQPFVQLDSRLSRSYTGTGLGLALVNRLTQMHAGTIQLDSTPGQGSRFIVTLPWHSNPSLNQPAPINIAHLSATVTSALVLDDSPIATGQLTQHLNELGIYRVTIHSQITGALERIRQVKPNVVFLDVMLPDGSGWEMLRELKADTTLNAIPVIITTVLDDRAQALALGAAEYLLKPVALVDLQRALDHAMQSIAVGANGQTPGTLPTKAQPTILLAEDSAVNVQVVSGYLTHHGYVIAVAEDGNQALEKLIELRPAIVLMDIQMPGMDGLEATRQIRALSDVELAHTPIIALTALAMPGDREQCLAAGANDYMSKPIQLVELDRLIQRYLKS